MDESEPAKERGRFRHFLAQWWPQLLGALPLMGLGLIWAIGSVIRPGEPGAVLFLPLTAITMLAPPIALYGVVMLLAKKDARFFWTAFMGMIGTGLLCLALALAERIMR